MIKLKIYLITEVLKGRQDYYYLRLLKVYVFGSSKRAILIYRLAKYFYDKGNRVIAKFLFMKLEREYSIDISPKAAIGIGLKLPHPFCIVIGNGVVIEDFVTIYHQVTIGGARIGDAKNKFYPFIGSHSVLFAGAKILGDIHVGSKCIVGANSVVLQSVPPCHTAVGAPSKFYKIRNEIDDAE